MLNYMTFTRVGPLWLAISLLHRSLASEPIITNPNCEGNGWKVTVIGCDEQCFVVYNGITSMIFPCVVSSEMGFGRSIRDSLLMLALKSFLCLIRIA